jgi:hypothetical protein
VTPHREIIEQDNPDFKYPEQLEASGPRYNKKIENLLIVCCHAIFHPDVEAPSFPTYSPHDESNWHLAAFQKSDPTTGKPGEHETFLAHIQAGLDAMTTGTNATWKEDVPWNQDSTILIFSGGATKQSLTPLSEARSYYHAALAGELAQGHIGGGRARQLYSKGHRLVAEPDFQYSIVSPDCWTISQEHSCYHTRFQVKTIPRAACTSDLLAERPYPNSGHRSSHVEC